jgi:thioredoxin 1
VPVLVDFWAPWCAPCRRLAPIVDTVASELRGRLKVVKVDIDTNIEIAGRFGVRSIPTLMLFKQGRAIEVMVGLVSHADLTRAILPHVALTTD